MTEIYNNAGLSNAQILKKLLSGEYKTMLCEKCGKEIFYSRDKYLSDCLCGKYVKGEKISENE